MTKHVLSIHTEMITTGDRDRVQAYRVHCTCGYLGSPVMREQIAEHEGNKHLQAVLDLGDHVRAEWHE